jgi:phage baseplate assembly protein W
MNYVDIAPKINDDYLINDRAIMASMKNILNTPVGSVPGHPEFGSGLGKYLFEHIDLLTEHLIKEEVEYALKRWEPRVLVTDIKVKEDFDYNRILISMSFKIVNEPDNPEREYIFSADV